MKSLNIKSLDLDANENLKEDMTKYTDMHNLKQVFTHERGYTYIDASQIRTKTTFQMLKLRFVQIISKNLMSGTHKKVTGPCFHSLS